MISSLHGTVLRAGADHVVVGVGGVGFQVAVPADVAHTSVIGGELLLHTNLVVRDDSLSLYGFLEPEELEIFTLLTTVTGVGPKSALGVLSHLTADQIAQAVFDEDDAPFRRVSGIGPKTAKLIVLQLAGKVQAVRPAATVPQAASGITDQVAAALVGLGWSEKVAAEAASAGAEDASEAELASVSSLLRRTLSLLGPAKGGAARG